MSDCCGFSPAISRGEQVTFRRDDDAGGLLVLGRITRSVVSISPLAWCIRYIFIIEIYSS